jgi:Pentapeptide repeats (8 copies)
MLVMPHVGQTAGGTGVSLKPGGRLGGVLPSIPVSIRSVSRERIPISPPPLAWSLRRLSGIVDTVHEMSDARGLNWHDCGMPDPETTSAARFDVARSSERKTHGWSRPSPWAWGLGILLVIGVIAVTQVPRLSAIGATKPKASPAATAMPTLAGPAYTQVMVANRDFVRADLRGARLIHLDLRGKIFQHAEAAGAVFTGSLLNGANLSHADLRGADLRDTCLRGAILTNADLSGADFTGADVTGAVVTPAATAQAIGWASIPAASVCPEG